MEPNRNLRTKVLRDAERATYQDVCQTGTGPFNEKERDEFRKLVDRQVDPNVYRRKIRAVCRSSV